MNDDALTLRLGQLVKLQTERYVAVADGHVYAGVIGTIERAMLPAVLAHVNGNQTHAARMLGINRNTLRKKMKAHGLLTKDVAG